ncbi:hypothetical protein PoB_003112900 [Plakobranchus ocellatus]|uniref:Uncharacterized protein n=1 Tax=Plakobranchus ocellatus TaxID=259542 RepID=A0AAV4AAD7_9GAST|nr:hypothetical protein PoB_003112900 [Plakobranchus ocellatus]
MGSSNTPHEIRKGRFLSIASPPKDGLRLSGPPSSQGAGGEARIRDRRPLQISGQNYIHCASNTFRIQNPVKASQNTNRCASVRLDSVTP